MYSSFAFKLKSLYECPLSMEDLNNPAILPSGITIEQDFAQGLINNKQKDPYNRNENVNKIIVNRFAKDVKKIITDFENIQADIERNKAKKDMSCQTEFIVRSKDDIQKLISYSQIW
mmetsp:Transcript_22213/g.19737  ORF Transcript_22213/g.19737 Transcript_22213/m.19737 type:complete len:117 (+) Transcript_22213:242-592(+)